MSPTIRTTGFIFVYEYIVCRLIQRKQVYWHSINTVFVFRKCYFFGCVFSSVEFTAVLAEGARFVFTWYKLALFGFSNWLCFSDASWQCIAGYLSYCLVVNYSTHFIIYFVKRFFELKQRPPP